MNRKEAVLLARYVRALCPQQKFDEYTPDAWADLLEDFEFADCKEACKRLGRQQPFISPAEIIAEVRSARRAWVNNFRYEPGDPEESGLEFVLRQRAQIAEYVRRGAAAVEQGDGSRGELPAARVVDDSGWVS